MHVWKGKYNVKYKIKLDNKGNIALQFHISLLDNSSKKPKECQIIKKMVMMHEGLVKS